MQSKPGRCGNGVLESLVRGSAACVAACLLAAAGVQPGPKGVRGSGETNKGKMAGPPNRKE